VKQQNLQFSVRCVVKTEERETVRRSAKESASLETHFGLERESPLEPRVESAYTQRRIRERRIT